jgi:DNA (cytosine-5)-methyltransferase 1
VPIIDLFAGPGGLGEGFSQVGWKEGNPFFKIGLSVEKEASAHNTLRLRSFLRQFPYNEFPEEYFTYLREGVIQKNCISSRSISPRLLLLIEKHGNDELRADKQFNKELDSKIMKALNGRNDWVLIGGPPCQAYSLVGRSQKYGYKDLHP